MAITKHNIVRRDRNFNDGGITFVFEYRGLSHGPFHLEFLAVSVHNGKICICLLYRPLLLLLLLKFCKFECFPFR